ncbi:Per1-like protein [Lipomyces oligophaga]|uniref:Per1-like protein n=1 Tax=Lipomyces oligophaga TaxID=45792 RepID=UPI0034CE8ADA
MRTSPNFIEIFLCGLYIAVGVLGSAGDRLPEFRVCVEECKSMVCDSVDTPHLAWYLTALMWDCPQNCDYNCQRRITAERISKGEEVLQFHGKWPFKRLLGIQEPASVLFSILNFVPHFKSFQKFRKSFPADNARTDFFLKKYYIWMTVVGMNAWLWSSVFHTRDFVVTERLDYFSAGATIMTGFFVACIRIFRLDRQAKSPIRRALVALCLTAFSLHVAYLSLIRFSYTYNMAANVVIGLIQNGLWIFYSLTRYFGRPREQRNPWVLRPMLIVLTISTGMGFELFDFSPFVDTIDAHSLWHAATVIPTGWLYDWIYRDAFRQIDIKRKM